MRKSRKLLSLVLVLALTLPMVFAISSASAACADERVVFFVKSTGGPVNAWAQPAKKANTILFHVKNGKTIEVLCTGTYFYQIKYDGKVGWMDKNYIGSKKVCFDPAPAATYKCCSKAKLVGSASNSIINLWKAPGGTSKWASFTPGKVFANVKFWSTGWAEVCFELTQGNCVIGYIRSANLVCLDVAPCVTCECPTCTPSI